MVVVHNVEAGAAGAGAVAAASCSRPIHMGTAAISATTSHVRVMDSGSERGGSGSGGGGGGGSRGSTRSPYGRQTVPELGAVMGDRCEAWARQRRCPGLQLSLQAVRQCKYKKHKQYITGGTCQSKSAASVRMGGPWRGTCPVSGGDPGASWTGLSPAFPAPRAESHGQSPCGPSTAMSCNQWTGVTTVVR